jgi:hypothetical protein
MSYIGNPPLVGSYKKIDDISSGFNGVTTTFNLTSSSTAVTPGTPNALIISLGGVVQEPTSSYTVSGSTITFTTAPAASTAFFGVMLGDVLYVGVSSGTVAPGMLSTGGPSWDTTGQLSVTGAIIENAQTISANYTITSSKNAMSAGLITINSGVTVTVPSGSTWTIV